VRCGSVLREGKTTDYGKRAFLSEFDSIEQLRLPCSPQGIGDLLARFSSECEPKVNRLRLPVNVDPSFIEYQHRREAAVLWGARVFSIR